MNMAHSTPELPDSTLDQVLQNLGSGEQEHFETLYRRYRGLVFSTAQNILNNIEDAEDVTQDVFVSALQKGALFDPKRGSAKTWLASVARNRAIDRFRSKKRRAKLSNSYEEELDTQNQDERNEIEEGISLKETAQAVRSAVLQLTREQREVIEMTYFKGMSQREVAEQIGAPLGTIKARARRGIIRLRTIIPENEEIEVQ